VLSRRCLGTGGPVYWSLKCHQQTCSSVRQRLVEGRPSWPTLCPGNPAFELFRRLRLGYPPKTIKHVFDDLFEFSCPSSNSISIPIVPSVNFLPSNGPGRSVALAPLKSPSKRSGFICSAHHVLGEPTFECDHRY